MMRAMPFVAFLCQLQFTHAAFIVSGSQQDQDILIRLLNANSVGGVFAVGPENRLDFERTGGRNRFATVIGSHVEDADVVVHLSIGNLPATLIGHSLGPGLHGLHIGHLLQIESHQDPFAEFGLLVASLLLHELHEAYLHARGMGFETAHGEAIIEENWKYLFSDRFPELRGLRKPGTESHGPAGNTELTIVIPWFEQAPPDPQFPVFLHPDPGIHELGRTFITIARSDGRPISISDLHSGYIDTGVPWNGNEAQIEIASIRDFATGANAVPEPSALVVWLLLSLGGAWRVSRTRS
jgi:hypothetical protein